MRTYKLLLMGTVLLMPIGAHADSLELTAAIDAVRMECGNVALHLSDMRKRAGMNTAVTSLGTAAGVGATATGVARSVQVNKMSEIDEQITTMESERDRLRAEIDAKNAEWNAKHGPAWNAIATIYAQLKGLSAAPKHPDVDDSKVKELEDQISSLRNERAKRADKANAFGNTRTGLAAVSTTTNVVGAVVASKNTGQGDLADAIRLCDGAVKNLQNVHMQVRLDESVPQAELNTASQIITACREVGFIDISKITKRAKGAMGASIAAAVTGGVATVTSGIAVAQTDATAQKTRDLDTTSNVFSGATGAASLTAVVFNATQISAIKKASEVMDKCEEVLK